jgi:hypothetical protein
MEKEALGVDIVMSLKEFISNRICQPGAELSSNRQWSLAIQ